MARRWHRPDRPILWKDARRPSRPPVELAGSRGLCGEDLPYPGDALVADPHCHDGRGVGIHGLSLSLEECWDLLPGLAAELAEDRGKLHWLWRGRLLLVVGFQERCFVPDGVDVGVARGCSAPSTGYLRSPEDHMPSRACRGTIDSSTRSWRTTPSVGEAGSPVRSVSLPGRRAAGGRPRGRPWCVEKLLPAPQQAWTQRSGTLACCCPFTRVPYRLPRLVELATGSGSSSPWSSSPSPNAGLAPARRL